jgi:predicted PurR-regulated permease PerM
MALRRTPAPTRRWAPWQLADTLLTHMSSPPAPLGSRLLVPLASLVVVIAGLKLAQPLLIPLVFAAFVAVLCAPAVEWMTRRRVPTVVAVPLVVLGVVAVLVAVGGLVGTSVKAFEQAAPHYTARLDVLVAGATLWLSDIGIKLTTEGLREMVQPAAVMRVMQQALVQVASLLSDVLLVGLTVVFILFEAAALPAKLRTALGDPEADLGRFSKVSREVKRYIIIKTYVSGATGLVVWLALSLMGIDFAPLWGVLAFLLNYVPNIGSIIAAIPPVLLAVVQFGPGRAAAVLAAYAGVNMLIGNVVEPHLMGRRLGLSTLVVFLSLIVWGWLWGAAGMLLSVPLTIVAKLLLENSESWRWLAQLMESKVEEPAEPASP